MLRVLLADKIEMEPVVEDGRRGYRCRGVLRINPLLVDAGITSLTVVAPTGRARTYIIQVRDSLLADKSGRRL